MEVQVRHADITEEERRKILNRMAVIAGLMLDEIKQTGIVNKDVVEELREKQERKYSKNK